MSSSTREHPVAAEQSTINVGGEGDDPATAVIIEPIERQPNRNRVHQEDEPAEVQEGEDCSEQYAASSNLMRRLAAFLPPEEGCSTTRQKVQTSGLSF